MKIAYVVTHGFYSDYGIDAVFSTKAAADEFVEANGGEVEEFPMDAPRSEWFLTNVHMRRNGDVEGEPYTFVSIDGEATSGLGFTHGSDPWELVANVTVRTEDKMRAVKVANERRAQFLANGQMPKCHSHAVTETPDGRWLCRDLRWSCSRKACRALNNQAVSTCQRCGAKKDATDSTTGLAAATRALSIVTDSIAESTGLRGEDAQGVVFAAGGPTSVECECGKSHIVAPSAIKPEHITADGRLRRTPSCNRSEDQ